MNFKTILKRKIFPKFDLKEEKKGIIFVKDIFPYTTISSLLNFFRNFGKLKRIFFLKKEKQPLSNKKKGRLTIMCFVEFLKKISAKRLSVVFRSLMDLPFKEVFYLKNTNWYKLIRFLT
jgi:hypothetical protein